MTRGSRARRRPSVAWVVLLGVVGTVIAGAIAAAIVLQPAGEHKSTSESESSSAVPAGAGGVGAGARGCMAGPGITAAQLKQIRATKDLTPTGAVEFLGAFKQFMSAGDPYYRAGVERVVQEMTDGDAREIFSTATPSTGPNLPNTHSTDLSQAYYRVVSASTASVVVDIASIQVENGARVSAGNGQYYFGGGRYTLAPSDSGWVIDAVTGDGVTVDDIRSTGYRFEGGC